MAREAEEHRADVRYHHGAHGVGHAAASAAKEEDRAVDELPAQLSDSLLPLSLTLQLVGADLGVPIPKWITTSQAIVTARVYARRGPIGWPAKPVTVGW